jgi:chromosome segregation ATPase
LLQEEIQREQAVIAETEAVASSNLQSLELELESIREQRAGLLGEIETLTKRFNQKDAHVQELRQAAGPLVEKLQEERDDAQTELELLRLEMGIVQSAARQLAQQAERTRREVLAKESSWRENLQKKESENARLRARIERMERGLSSLFVKRPAF